MHILFMPVSDTDSVASVEYGGAFTQNQNQNYHKNAQWIAGRGSAPGRANEQWTEVWFTGSANPALTGLHGANVQIYIRGHGHAGDSSIQLGVGGTRVTFTEVVRTLTTSGLPKTFNGMIKCFNCHSSEKGAQGEQSFAMRFARLMYEEGYKNCRYFGYTGQLDSFHKQGSAGLHKYARGWQVTTSDDGIRMGTQVERSRARDARSEIFPSRRQRLMNAVKGAFGR